METKNVIRSDLNLNVHQALVYFGQMSISEIIQKLKMRNIEATESQVLSACKYLINRGDIRVADYDSEVLVPVRTF